MPSFPRTLSILMLLLALVGPARASALAIGAGDETPAMFSDPRFKELDVRYARLDVAWNAIDRARQLQALATWLKAARTDGVEALVTFDHGEERGWHHTMPTAARFGEEFARFRKLFPWVKDFATWNEANYCGQPTCHKAALIAHYYRRIVANCGSCRVLGAELLDTPNMVTWVRQFRRALGGAEPMVWGLHNYIGANRLQTRSTLSLLRATRAPIWFTETGGLVSRANHSSIGFPESAAHAAKVTSFLFDVLARLSPRIARVYIYQWDGAGPAASWDSGLIAPDGRPRPAYAVFVRALEQYGQLPDTTGASAILASVSGG
jgi:hypothetical protein